MLCADRKGRDVVPEYPCLIPAQFFPTPLPRSRLSPSALVTDVPCTLCCVRVRQDEDGDGGRKEDGHVMNF